MRILRQDLRFGFRVLKNSPIFTVVAVLTLALGIAVNTTVFSWIDGILLHPLPGAGDPASLAQLETVTSSGEYLASMSYLDYCDYRDNLKQVAGVAVGRITPLSIGLGGKTERAWAELVSANYFDVLRVKPVLGRTFLAGEAGNQAGAYPVAVISYNMWRTRYHRDPKVLGKTLRLNRHELTIVGVAPPEFRGTMAGLAFDVWMPVTMATAMGTGTGTLTFRGTRDLTTTLVRLKPGVTLEQARAEVSAFAGRLAAAYPRTNRSISATLVPPWKGHNGVQVLLAGPLRILMGVSLLMLLIVCANVSNLLLARAVSRQREFGIRLALGARRLRLARQLLTETLLLALAGGLGGVLMVLWMGQSLTSLLPPNDFPIAISTGVDLRTLGFSLLMAIVATVISGTAPALVSARNDLNETLKEGGRGGGAGTQSHRLRGLLVACEVALAMVALAGAGLFYRSFRNASTIHPGFDMTNISVSQFYLSSAGYTAEEQRQFCRTLRERLEAMPGITAVSYSDTVPLTFAGSPWHQIEVEGYIPGRNEDMNLHRALVPPGYFNLMRIPLLEGRDFTERDEAGAEPVITVNETFARRFFGDRSPLGRRVRRDGGTWTTVVGVVSDSKYHSPTESPLAFAYMPFRQFFAPGLNFTVYIQTAGDPRAVTETLRKQALALNQDAVFHSELLSEATMAALYPQKVAASLLSVVGVVCLLLAAIGLYSVMSYAVSQRTHEVGIRMALGARPGDVRSLVVRQGLMLTLPGLAVGVAAGLAAGRLAGGMLVGVSPGDPLTFGTAAAFLALVAVVASYVPALRATRVDPMAALRCQ